MLSSVGTARHSTASSARGDTKLEDLRERIRELEEEKETLKNEVSSLFFCADGLREKLNTQQEHHETRCAEWGSQMTLSNFKMEAAKALIPEENVAMKMLLNPITIPSTTKKARLPSSYLMDNTTIRDGLINVARPLLVQLNAAEDENV